MICFGGVTIRTCAGLDVEGEGKAGSKDALGFLLANGCVAVR